MVCVKHLAQHKRRSTPTPVRHVPFEETHSVSSTKSILSSSGRSVNLSDLLNNPPSDPSVPPVSTRKRSHDSFVAEILHQARQNHPFSSRVPSGPSKSVGGPSVGPSAFASKIHSPPIYDEDVPIVELFRRANPPSQGKPLLLPPRPPVRHRLILTPTPVNSTLTTLPPSFLTSPNLFTVVFHPMFPRPPGRHLFLHEGAQSRWKYVILCRIAFEKALNDEMLHCHDIIDLIRHAGLLQSVTDLVPFYPRLVQEFIVNLHFDLSKPLSSDYQTVVVRGKLFRVSPSSINSFLGSSNDPSAELPSPPPSPKMVSNLTGGFVSSWRLCVFLAFLRSPSRLFSQR